MNGSRKIEDDYKWATIRLVLRRDDTRLALVFGMVELMPGDMPRQPTMPPQSLKIPKTNRGYCYFRHVSLSAARAVAWYADAIAGRLRTPVDNDTESIPGDDELVITPAYSHEPPWPYLVVGGDLPFLADWQVSPRVHQLIPSEGAPAQVAALLTHDRIRAWLHTKLFFDLYEYPEWQGGMVIVAPNPVFRRVERRRLPAGDQANERTLVRFHFRSDAASQGLRLISWDRRGDAMGHLRRRE
jgi:hypothetical protein